MSEQGPVSIRATEQLSAYLDGRLERSEAARLEARLRQDPQLRLELQELRMTVQALSSLPLIRPPRSFILQPQAIRRPGGYPLLQLGTALATLSFLVVVGTDLLLVRAGSPILVASREIEAPAAEPAVGAQAPALDQQLGLAQEATPEAVPEEESASEDLAQAQAESAVPTATGQPDTLKYGAGEEATAEPGAAESAAAATPAAGDAAEAPAAPEPGREAELQASARQDGDTVSEQPAAAEPQELTTNSDASSRGSPLLRAVEVGLGATAVVLGVLTIRARRRQS